MSDHDKKEATLIEGWQNPGDGEGYDGPISETDEAKAARLAFESEYDDPKPVAHVGSEYVDGEVEEVDEYLTDAANTLFDPTASTADRDESRQIIADNLGLEDIGGEVEDVVPESRAEYVKMLREAQRPENPYGEDDSKERHAEAVAAVDREQRIVNQAHALRGDPGYRLQPPRVDESDDVSGIDDLFDPEDISEELAELEEQEN